MLHRGLEAQKEHEPAAANKAKQLKEMPGTLPHFVMAIGLLYGLNQGLSKLTSALGIQFPSALIGKALSCLQSLQDIHVLQERGVRDLEPVTAAYQSLVKV